MTISPHGDVGASTGRAVQVCPGRRADPPVALLCEHASQRLLPDGRAWPAADRRLLGTHWAYDLGAADLTRDLAETLGAPAVYAGFSRLLVDPNRGLSSPTLFRLEAEGLPVMLNQDLTEAERQRRIDELWRAYHAAADHMIETSTAPTVLSMHTFTPVYEGIVRHEEVGVLFDRDEALAEAVAERLWQEGLKVGLNVPYSGRDGMMYSVDRHAASHRRQALELEVRQDLAVLPAFRRRLVTPLAAVLEETAP
ncbi:MAG: N-formylglutamate amidohydrolase [Sandaracinaceae bacterium]